MSVSVSEAETKERVKRKGTSRTTLDESSRHEDKRAVKSENVCDLESDGEVVGLR